MGRLQQGEFRVAEGGKLPSDLLFSNGNSRPKPVIHVRQIERLVPPEAAMPLSGSRIDRIHDR